MQIENDFYLVDEAAIANSTTTTSVEDFIPEIWSQRVRDFRDDNLIVTQLMEVDTSLQGPGDLLHIMKYVKDDLTPEAHTETATVATKEITSDEVQLIPETKAVRVIVSDQSARRSIPNMVSRAAERLGVAHAELIEDTLIGELEEEMTIANYEDQIIDDSGTAITAALLKGYFSQATTKFAKANYGDMEKFAVMRPEEYELVLDDSQFVDASEFGGREAVLNGEVARYKGFRILQSNRLRQSGEFGNDSDDHDMWFLVRDSCTVAYKQQPTIETERIIERLATQVVSSIDFGVVLVYPDRVVRAVFEPAA